MKKIILFGTGNLGKRYLQAILSSGGNFTCHCYDVSREALDGIDDFLKANQVPATLLSKHYRSEDILKEINQRSLVIVASTANGRRALVSDILRMHPGALIIEKPVTQTENDYLAIMEECKNMGIPAFTHYTLRFQPFCKVLKEMVGKENNYELISLLPAMGIACVSIHYIDLFLWLFDIKSPGLTAYDLHGIYEQKRKGFYDMYGEITIRVPGRGAGRFINSEVNGLRSLIIGLEDRVISVFEDQRVMTVVEKKSNNTISSLEVGYQFASHYLTRIIENFIKGDINASGELVTLEEGYLSHRIIFDFMKATGNIDLNIT
jgi:predicted dehydrogenase